MADQKRIAPDAIQTGQLVPEAAPTDTKVQYQPRAVAQPDLTQAKTMIDTAEGVLKFSQGALAFDNVLRTQAVDTATTAYDMTEANASNKKDWKDVSQNLHGMAKWNPYVQDSYKSLVAKDVFEKGILTLEGTPNLETKSPQEVEKMVTDIKKGIYGELNESGLQPSNYEKYVSSFDDYVAGKLQKHASANAEYVYTKLAIPKMSHQAGLDLINGNYSTDPIEKEQQMTASLQKTVDNLNSTGVPITDQALILKSALHQYIGYDPTGAKESQIMSAMANVKLGDAQPQEVVAPATADDAKEATPISADGTESTTPVDATLQTGVTKPATKTNSLSIFDIDPTFRDTLHNDIKAAKDEIYEDKVRDYNYKELDKKIKVEDALTELVKLQMSFGNNPTPQQQQQLKSMAVTLTQQGGLYTEYGNLLGSLNTVSGQQSNLLSSNTDANTYNRLMIKAYDKTLTKGDILSGMNNGLLSSASAKDLMGMREGNIKEGEQDAYAIANVYSKGVDTYLTSPEGKRMTPESVSQIENERNQAMVEVIKTKDYKKFNTKMEKLYTLAPKLEQMKTQQKGTVQKIVTTGKPVKGANDEYLIKKLNFVQPQSITSKGSQYKYTNDTKITSYVGQRVAPKAGASTWHKGYDVAAPEGSLIKNKIGNGKVSAMGYEKGWGNYIVIDYGNNRQALYGHLSAYKKGIGVGSTVRTNDTFGFVGHSGNTTGNEVHTEFWKNYTIVNATDYFKGSNI